MTRFAYTVHVTVENPDDKWRRRTCCIRGVIDSDVEENPGAYGIAATVDALQDAAEQAIEAAGNGREEVPSG